MELQPILPPNDQNRVYHASRPISIPPSFTRSTRKQISVQFDGGQMTSDVGVLLLPPVDRKLRLTERINELIRDPRNQRYVCDLTILLIFHLFYSELFSFWYSALVVFFPEGVPSCFVEV